MPLIIFLRSDIDNHSQQLLRTVINKQMIMRINLNKLLIMIIILNKGGKAYEDKYVCADTLTQKIEIVSPK